MGKSPSSGMSRRKGMASRRHFLKTAAATAGVAVVSRPLVMLGAQADSTEANSKLNLAVVGCGGQGRGVMRGLLSNGAHLVALCDPDVDMIEKARAGALKSGGDATTEAKAYEIAGAKRKKKGFRCPGLDHAAAFPIEIVVMQDGEKVKVAILDEMYRMKVFFEDAGMLAFAKNMAMPGRIEDEIRRMALLKLK